MLMSHLIASDFNVTTPILKAQSTIVTAQLLMRLFIRKKCENNCYLTKAKNPSIIANLMQSAEG